MERSNTRAMASVEVRQGAARSGAGPSRRLRRRHGADLRLRIFGIVAIAIAALLLGTFVVSLIRTGAPAFVQSMVSFEIFLDPAKIDPANPQAGNYRAIVREGLLTLFPNVTSPRDRRKLHEIPSPGAQHLVRRMVLDEPELVGKTITITVPLSDPFDLLHKGETRRDVPEEERRVKDDQIAWYDRLDAEGRITSDFSWTLFLAADSRFPELAGLSGALSGSFYALLVCFMISFPTGLAAAVYLEEFASKNRWVEILEVNINNLAAVPSVVFGLLGLAVFLDFFGLPRSAPLVGGMVLSLMTLPTIIIVTRAALKSVPSSIREAAFGIGASKHQVVQHHVLPLAMPGVLTGTIIGLAQALGETAPLLLIGMNAFITSDPGGLLDPATALPTQIFIWADSPERGFVARTSAAILVLLSFLIVMNGTAVYLRKRFERKW